MDGHKHENYDVYGVATAADVEQLRSEIRGLREDLTSAGERIGELERDVQWRWGASQQGAGTGHEVAAPVAPHEEKPVPSLMDALRTSLTAAGGEDA